MVLMRKIKQFFKRS